MNWVFTTDLTQQLADTVTLIRISKRKNTHVFHAVKNKINRA